MLDAAVYEQPHFLDEGTMALIMRHRLTHHNLQSNSHACYMFIEKGPGYKGKRLFLTKVREEQDSELLKSCDVASTLILKISPNSWFFFRVDKELSLVGAGT